MRRFTVAGRASRDFLRPSAHGFEVMMLANSTRGFSFPLRRHISGASLFSFEESQSVSTGPPPRTVASTIRLDGGLRSVEVTTSNDPAVFDAWVAENIFPLLREKEESLTVNGASDELHPNVNLLDTLLPIGFDSEWRPRYHASPFTGSRSSDVVQISVGRVALVAHFGKYKEETDRAMAMTASAEPAQAAETAQQLPSSPFAFPLPTPGASSVGAFAQLLTLYGDRLLLAGVQIDEDLRGGLKALGGRLLSEMTTAKSFGDSGGINRNSTAVFPLQAPQLPEHLRNSLLSSYSDASALLARRANASRGPAVRCDIRMETFKKLASLWEPVGSLTSAARSISTHKTAPQKQKLPAVRNHLRAVDIVELAFDLALLKGKNARSLDGAAQLLLGFQPYKSRSLTMQSWERWPLLPQASRYAALDAICGLDCWHFLTGAVKELGLTPSIVAKKEENNGFLPSTHWEGEELDWKMHALSRGLVKSLSAHN